MEEGDGGKTRAPQLWLLHSCNGALSHKYFREVNCPSAPPSCAHYCGSESDCRERERQKREIDLSITSAQTLTAPAPVEEWEITHLFHFFHLSWHVELIWGFFGGSIASLTLCLVISTREVILFFLLTDSYHEKIKANNAYCRNYPPMQISNDSL